MQPEKKLYKIGEGKVLDGVCGGIAEYFRIDQTLVRLAWAVFGVAAFGSGVAAYVVAALVMPRKPEIMV